MKQNSSQSNSATRPTIRDTGGWLLRGLIVVAILGFGILLLYIVY